MRNKTFISSMVGVAAAVAVAGSANAGLATGKIDGFTGSFAGWTGRGMGDSTGPLQYANGTLGFNDRDLGTQGFTKNASGGKQLVTTANVNSVTGGNQVQALVKAAGTGATGMTTNAYGMFANFIWANANFDSSGNVTSLNSFDMSNASSFTVSFANNTFGTSGFAGTNLRFAVGVTNNGEPAEWFVTKSVFGSGGTVTFSTADFDAEFGAGTAANWSNLGTVQLYVNWDCPSGLSAGTNLGNVTLTDFSYNAVPAPGALALLGAAGIVGARRRRA